MKKLLLASMLTTLFLAACDPAAQEQEMMMEEEGHSDSMMMEEEESDESAEENTMVIVDADGEVQVEVVTAPVTTQLGSPEYTDFSQTLHGELLGSEAHVVYFHADWCPTCRQLEADVTASLQSFPEGTKILKANYDNETKLKQDYGVVTQTTLVVFDAEGNQTQKLVAPTTAELKAAIEASI